MKTHDAMILFLSHLARSMSRHYMTVLPCGTVIYGDDVRRAAEDFAAARQHLTDADEDAPPSDDDWARGLVDVYHRTSGRVHRRE